MPSPVLGIDLGTTNSVVAHADEHRVRVLRDREGHLLTPSTVSFAATGEVSVGRAARDLRMVDAAHTVFSVKRLIGRPFRSPEVGRAVQRLPFKLEEGPTGAVVVRMRDQTYSLPEISAFILRHLRELAERSLGQRCHQAVITVPANFNELQRMATRDAGRIAGLSVLRILNEPTAAALAYGYTAQQSQRIAVYDFGGGTFDISILELSGDVIEVVATAGDTQLGGDDLDRAIAERMLAQFQQQHGADLTTQPHAFERLTLAAEWIKCQLTELDAAEATIKRLPLADGAKVDFKFRLGRSELHTLCSPLVSRTFEICEDALRVAAVRPSQLDAVLLVGGQTRTPRVREMVREYFGMEPKSSVDPDLAVAHGAALQAHALSGSAGSEPERRFSRTLAGTPIPDKARDLETGGFEDEPTRVAEPTEIDAAGDAARRSDRVHAPKRESRQPGKLPSLRPERGPSTHASTLTGVGQSKKPPQRADTPVKPGFSPIAKPTLRPARDGEPHASTLSGFGDPLADPGDRPSASDVVTVTSDLMPASETLRPSVPPIGMPSSHDWRPAPRPPSETIASRPRVETVPLPPLAASVPPPTAAAGRGTRDPAGGLAPQRTAAPATLSTRPFPERAERVSEPNIDLPALRTSKPPAPEPEPHPQMSPIPAPHPANDVGSRRTSVKPPPPPPPRPSRASFLRGESAPPLSTHPTPIPPSAASQSTSQFPGPPSIAPLLLDVTPHTLSVETVGGFCELIIERNAPIPTEQTRMFTTSRDNQPTVSVRVCQGESRRTDENQVLGHIELVALRPARQGELNIAVTFAIDADGTLNVRALDQDTGQGQELRVNLTGAIDPAELEQLQLRHRVLAS